MITAETQAPVAPAWLAPLVRGGGALLALAPFLPPIADRAGFPALAALLDAPWVSACHRMPERSLFMFGEPMPLCTRCLGLVVGLGLGLAVAWPPMSLRALRIAFGLGCAFLFLELTTQDLGWHPVFHPTRILSGLLVAFPVGAAAGAIVKKLGAGRGALVARRCGCCSGRWFRRLPVQALPSLRGCRNDVEDDRHRRCTGGVRRLRHDRRYKCGNGRPRWSCRQRERDWRCRRRASRDGRLPRDRWERRLRRHGDRRDGDRRRGGRRRGDRRWHEHGRHGRCER